MAKQQKPSPGRAKLASSLVATVFLIFIFILIIVSVLYFTLLRPKDLKLSVTGVQLPSFSVSDNNATFIFSLYAAVTNPNKAVFTHSDSILQLLHSGHQIGFMFIPAGKISAGRTQNISASFSVPPFPLKSPVPATVDPTIPVGVNKRLEIESRLRMSGWVRVLLFFHHPVQARTSCEVSVSAINGSISGLHC